MNSAHPNPRTALPAGQVFDVLVAGGGATGLGVALEAAQRGFKVALFESHDFASGTSSRSTKLLHGGVRYLAQGNLALVREALAERSAVLQLAPHLAQPLRFVMPAFAWWQQAFYGTGLMLYDLMAGRARIGRTRWLSRTRTLQDLPGLRHTGLHGGVAYWDGQFDDARLALTLARSAQTWGAQLHNHTQVTAVEVSADGLHQVQLRDRLDHTQASVQARCVINATGVWVDELRQQGSPQSAHPAHHLVSPSQGVHLVVDRSFMPADAALLVPRTRDGRVLFAVPWLGKLVLGTTDTPRTDLPREPQAFAHERQFILQEASAVLQRPVTEDDVLSEWVGLRPLVAPPGHDVVTRKLSREHTIVQDSNGLVTVIGGKWTTYRAMAVDVLEHCMAHGLLERRKPGQRMTPLLGAPASGQASTPLHQAPGLHLYGGLASEVLACPGADRDLGMGLSEAMVRHAVRKEWACTVEDVLARRWRALFLDARQAARMGPEVAAILRDEGVAEPGLDDFTALCSHYLPPGLTGAASHAQAS